MTPQAVKEDVKMNLAAKLRNLSVHWYFFKSYQKDTAITLVAMVVAGVLESLNTAALYPIMHYGLRVERPGKCLEFLEPVLAFLRSDNFFVGSCFLLVLVTVISTLFRLYYHYVSNRLTTKVIAGYQKAMFVKYVESSYNYFVKSQQGRLIYASTVAPNSVSNSVSCIIRGLNSLTNCFFFAVVLLILAWHGTVMLLLIGFFYFFFVRRIITKVIETSVKEMVEEDQKKNILLNEFLTGIKSIKVFLVQNWWRDRYFFSVKESVRHSFRVNMARALPDCFIKFAFYLLLGVAGVVLSFWTSGQIHSIIPLLGTYVAVSARLLPYMNLLGNDILSVARATPDVKIVYDIMNKEVSEVEGVKKELRVFEREIVFDHVWFKHEDAEDFLLKDVCFAITKRKVTAIVGKSGSGKTTVLNLLLRLFEAQRGCILIDGVDVRDYSKRSYLSMMGPMSQEVFIFNGTIKENIRFGAEIRSDAEIVRAAEIANAHEFIVKTEQGYDTVVGDAGIKLSGGERQRIAIARAVLRKPEIVVFDEATSSLDSISEKKIQESIKRISAQATVLMVAHRLSTVKYADRIIVFGDGRVVEEGQHEELLARKGCYAELYKQNA